jgi:glycosyltransferase involved in cell wall biosynthesis
MTRSEASVPASDVGTRRAVLRLALVTLGDPNRRTGGYRYHRMMAAAADDHRARVRFERVPPLPWPVPTVPAARTLRAAAEGSDAILLDSIAAAFAAPWIGPLRTPVVAVVHQPPGGLHGGRARRVAQRRLDGIAYRSAVGAIAAAESLVGDLRGVGVPVDRIVVVPPGCDLPVASGPPLDLRRGRMVSVLCVANWTPLKGIFELVDAFGGLPEQAATLWLVGATDADRRYAERVRRRIAAPDLSGRVVVRGSVPVAEVGRLYRSADVFALCSFVDAYGTAWAEALAAGLPIVGWRAGNLARLAVHGREALMAEPGDLAGLASALRAITTDGVLRERLAAGARHRGQMLPTWRDSASRFFAAVRELLRDRPS